MKTEKFYLQPKDFYDSCIVRESPYAVTYSVQLIINKLASSFAKEDDYALDEEAYDFEALEYYEFNIEPLALTYNILFDEIYRYENRKT